MTNYTAFESYYYDGEMFIAYIVCFVVKLAFNFIYTLSLQAAISQLHINFMVSFMTYFYLLNMPVDIITWRAVIGLFVNTTQQSTVFHLTKCQGITLYSMLLFLLLLIVFKEFSNNWDLILGTFFFLWPNGFFLEIKFSQTCH